jgi:hypothetical protein
VKAALNGALTKSWKRSAVTAALHADAHPNEAGIRAAISDCPYSA